MFWSGNFMVVREINFLLKEENVTLASVLEADDILQECKADNKALIQFLTRPDILAELITLITEEPPKNVELSQQYRQASIACEVLTSHLSTLSDRLTLDTVQMNRICDFINKDPPLNPLLASYFSKTVEMLLERSPKQDWYLYHIVCLRVLDFFKSRRDFLPNLLRHISTSAIADTFKYLIRLDDLFNKPIMEWLEEHQFLDSLIQIICGTYVPEHFPVSDLPEKGQQETSEKEHGDNHTKDNVPREPPHIAEAAGAGGVSVGSVSAGSVSAGGVSAGSVSAGAVELSAEEARMRSSRIAAVAASNAASLLIDLVYTGCAGEGSTRSRTSWQLASVLGGCACVRSILCNVFTCAPRDRARALQHAARLLHALLHQHTSENEEERCSVELAVAPHLPLLHQALLHDPQYLGQEEEGGGIPAPMMRDDVRVGAARIATAALIAQLAASEVEEVATTLLTLGTPGLLVDMMFTFPWNNFLHAQLVVLVRHALRNPLYRTQYATHLFMECDLLTRLMNAFEENEEDNMSDTPRAGYMGHVIQLLACISSVVDELGDQLRLPASLLTRWTTFRDLRLAPLLTLHDTPLGGTYPSDNMYDTGEELNNISDTLAAHFDFSDMAATMNMDGLGDDLASDHEMRNAEEHADSPEFIADGLGLDQHDDTRVKAQSSFLELASQRFDDDMWDEAPDTDTDEFGAPPSVDDTTDVWIVPAWESSSGGAGGAGGSAGGGGGGAGGEGWAQFDAFAPPDAFAGTQDPPFGNYWTDTTQTEDGVEGTDLSSRLRGLALEEASLANNLLTAMSAMSADAIANLVNANLQPLPLPPPQVNLPPEATVEVTTPNPVTPPAEFSNPPQSFPSEPPLPLPRQPPPPPSPLHPAPLTPTVNDTSDSTQRDIPEDKSREVTAPEPSSESESSTTVNDTSSEVKVDDTSSEVKVNDSSSEVKVDDTSSEVKVNDTSSEVKVDDISASDKVPTNRAKSAIESHSIQVSEGPLSVSDTSER